MEKKLVIRLEIRNLSENRQEVCLFDFESISKQKNDNPTIQITYLPNYTYEELLLSSVTNKYLIKGLQTNITNCRELHFDFKLNDYEIDLLKPYYKCSNENSLITRARETLHSFMFLIDDSSILKFEILPNETIVLDFNVYSYLKNSKRMFCENIYI